MLKAKLCVLNFLHCKVLFSQTSTITVAENTIKIAPQSEEVLYYGFSEGDQMILNFEEINGKELKELEIMFMPSSSIFMDYKTKKIEEKVLKIAETGIYKFRFANSNIISGRICKFKIQRIPYGEQTKEFNTTVYKKFIYDTTYYEDQEKYLVKIDTISNELVNQIAKVHSSSNMNGNKTTTNFTLPNNTISWSYYIGVDQAGQKAYENATKLLAQSSNSLAAKFLGASPLTSLALNLPSYLSQMQVGEDIDYYLVEGENVIYLLKNNNLDIIKKEK